MFCLGGRLCRSLFCFNLQKLLEKVDFFGFAAILLRSNTLYSVEKVYICRLIMRFWNYISVLMVVLFATSCREASTLFGYDTVVRVGRNTLSSADISAAVPKGLSGADSVSYVDSYIDKWIIRQLKLQEAELIFSSSEGDIDRMVEEYRQSLLIRKIEQYYLDKDVDFQISDADIESYYNSHKGDFRLTSAVVKGYIVSFPEKFRRKDWLLQMMRSAKGESGDKFKEFEQVCLKNNFRMVKYEEWVDYGEYLANLPLLRTANHDKRLSERGVQQIHYDATCYAFRITDVLSAGEPMPLFMAKDKIVRILTKRRQGEIVLQNEERIRQNANNNGLIRIYRDSLNINN